MGQVTEMGQASLGGVGCGHWMTEHGGLVRVWVGVWRADLEAQQAVSMKL